MSYLQNCKMAYLYRYFFWISLVLLWETESYAQSFYGKGGRLSDYGGAVKADTFTIVVEKLPVRSGTDFGLSKVCFDITHARISDLKVEIVTPSGKSIWLSNRNGRDEGQNYTSTCFRSNGFSGHINQAKAPFDGEYIPDGRFEFLNTGENPNGVWKLLITDLRREVKGALNYFTLEFSKNPMPTIGYRPCDFATIEGCSCGPNKDECELLPDLVILEKFTQTQIKEYSKNDPYYSGQLRFAAAIANIGQGPLEILGKNEWTCGGKPASMSAKCADGSFARQQIYQRVYSKKDGKLAFRDLKSGTNYFDDQPGHNHFHVDDWVEFRLVKKMKLASGKYKKQLVARSRKVSYCLFDSGICNTNDSLCLCNKIAYGNDNLDNYGLGGYSECKAEKQGISVGGYDMYGLMYEGQYIQLPKGLKNGLYFLEIEIDPTKKYKEQSRKNNLFSMPVTIRLQE